MQLVTRSLYNHGYIHHEIIIIMKKPYEVVLVNHKRLLIVLWTSAAITNPDRLQNKEDVQV